MAPRKRKFPPIYEHSLQDAAGRGELDQFYATQELNIECAKAITAALSEHYNCSTYCLDTAAASKEVVDKFGLDRTMRVLANTVRHFDYDGRLSRASKEWAHTIPAFPEESMGRYCLVNSNPGLTNLFVGQVRHDHLLTQPLKAPDIRAEAERILRQFQAAPEPNNADGTKFMAELSPDYIARAKSKDHVRLMALLPFPTLTLSFTEHRKGFFALISRDEDRNQPLRLRKPSIKAQLAAEPVPGEKPTKPKDREAR